MDKSIIPECFADTLLIETLVPSKKGYNHQHNCFKVEATMKRMDDFALGIIDKDKKQIRYLDKFELIDEVAGDLKLWRHQDLQVHHWIIQICPALEKWLLKICETENIDVSDFGENVFEGLKYYTKSAATLDSPILQKLFNTVRSKNGNINVRKLKGWIEILREKNYQAEKKELINA